MQLCIQKMRPPIQLSRKLEKQKHNYYSARISICKEEIYCITFSLSTYNDSGDGDVIYTLI